MKPYNLEYCEILLWHKYNWVNSIIGFTSPALSAYPLSLGPIMEMTTVARQEIRDDELSEFPKLLIHKTHVCNNTLLDSDQMHHQELTQMTRSSSFGEFQLLWFCWMQTKANEALCKFAEQMDTICSECANFSKTWHISLNELNSIALLCCWIYIKIGCVTNVGQSTFGLLYCQKLQNY